MTLEGRLVASWERGNRKFVSQQIQSLPADVAPQVVFDVCDRLGHMQRDEFMQGVWRRRPVVEFQVGCVKQSGVHMELRRTPVEPFVTTILDAYQELRENHEVVYLYVDNQPLQINSLLICYALAWACMREGG